jgi:hypothetical protein
VLALVALGLMSLGILYPKPLLVILAMSLGHAIGIAAVLAYFLAIVLDVAKVGAAPDSLAPAGPRTPSPVPAPPDETPDSSGRRGPGDENPE